MTDKRHNEEHNVVAGEAALIATFYGRRGQMQPLVDQLTGALTLTPRSPDDWQDSASETLLRCFDPVAAHDTTVVQLALNESGATDAAWTAMRRRLEGALDDGAVLKDAWGYMLIYQDILLSGVASDDPALYALLPAALRLYSPLSEVPQSLTYTDVSGGRLWLMDIPIQGDGLDAATVYVALGQGEQQARLVREWLYGPGAALLMPDLIAHKSYHQMRQYRVGDLESQYKKKLAIMRQTTDHLLNSVGEKGATTSELDVLACDYGLLVGVVASLGELRISLARQLHNYDWWQKRAGGGAVIEYHRNQLETAFRELELLTAEGQNALSAANTAVNMVQAQLDQRQERQRQRIEALLAIAGVALAIPQLIDREAAGALLRWVGVSVPFDNVILLLGAQVGITLVVALLAGLMVWLMGTRRRG